MTREEVQKLLGGFATGTLTPEEQQSLFSAALEDQELFDALANEQSLRDLLRDPAAKAELLAALDAPPPAHAGWIAWVRRPWVAGLAMAGIAAVGIAVYRGQGPERQPTIVAEVRPQAPPAGEAVTQPPTPAPTTPKFEARRDAVRQETDKVASTAARAPVPATAPPVTPPAQPVELKDTAVAPVLAESKPQPLQLAPAGQQSAGQSVVATGLQNSQNAAPSPMAQNMTNLSQQQSFRQSESQALLTAPSAMFDRALAGGAGGRKKAETASAFKITVLHSGNAETAASTPLAAGEGVKLRIVPNADGFLYVMDGNTPLANAQVKAQQQFETPELKSEGAGQRQIRIILSGTPMAAGIAGVIGGVPQSDTRAKLALAKEKVAQEPQPTEQTVTLTWR